MPNPSSLDYYRNSNYPQSMNAKSGNTTAPDIPILKKKENDKRGMPGFLWPGARLASGLGQWAGGSSSWVGGMLLSPAGPWLATGVMAGFLAGGLVGGTWLIGRSFYPAQTSVASASALAGVGPSGIRIYKPQDASLNNLTQANSGTIKSDDVPASFLNKANPTTQAAAKPAEAKPSAQDPNALANSLKAQLGINGANGQVGKLSSDTDGSVGSWNNLSKNIMVTENSSFHLKNNFIQAPAFAKTNTLSSSSFGKQAVAMASRLTQKGVTASRAMGQLKYGTSMSATGANAATMEAGHVYASNAFEQQSTQGGQLGAIGGMGLNTGGTGMVTPPGTGAPNPTPSAGPGQNATPWQPQTNSAQNSTLMAAIMMILSVAMIAIGVKLCMSSNPWTIAAGIAMIVAGMAVMALAIMKMTQADNSGNQINQQYNQPAATNAIDTCASQAMGEVKPANCKSTPTPQEKNLSNPDDNVHQAVTGELGAPIAAPGEGSSTAGIDGGEPIKKPNNHW